MNDYFDLFHPLSSDTILCVKYVGISNIPKWVHYNIPISRANGTERTFGDLYTYFSNRKDFRFAKGLVRIDDGENWLGQSQYFYFSKEEPPFIDVRQFKKPIYLPKKL